MSAKRYKIRYHETKLDTVLRFYADGFEAKEGEAKPEWGDAYVDTARGVVVFRLYILHDSEVPRP